jgi:hypothetical protein
LRAGYARQQAKNSPDEIVDEGIVKRKCTPEIIKKNNDSCQLCELVPDLISQAMDAVSTSGELVWI